MADKIIKVDYLARVEGEGGLYIKIRKNRVEEVRLSIFEPPRFFEALLRGRDYSEAVDINARICGICPIAYQMSTVHAMESAFGVTVGGQLRALRRLIYCGEWIESHTLHVYMLHAPDFLGYESALHMAKDHREIVERGLQIKKAGNDLIDLIGGRAVHPINVRVGGFYRVPTRRQLDALRPRLVWGREAARETVRWAATLPFPEFDGDYEFVSLSHPDEYPFNEGRLVSSRGLDIGIEAFDDHVVEEQVAHSNALHASIRGRGSYMVGPMARYNLNFEKFSPLAQEAAREAGLGPICRNPFKSILIRGVEILYAFDEALRIIDGYEEPERAAVEVRPRAGVGHGCTEAPRGSLYHRYRLDERGRILEAKIVPPTSQNQKAVEEDLRGFVEQHHRRPLKELTWKCEQAIRNYDPCISCATHFLRLDVDRA